MERNVKTFRFWIFLVGLIHLPLVGLFFSAQAFAETTAPTAINNPNPGIELWQAVRGTLDSPASTQVQGHDASVLVNAQGELWASFRINDLVPKSREWLLLVLLLLGLFYIVPGPARLKSG